MNIDVESIALLSLILRDAPQDRQFILCVLARSNQIPSIIKFHSNTEYPTFYGYSNERIPFYLMSTGVISNVPRKSLNQWLLTSEYLAFAETAINTYKQWNLSKKLEYVSKFIELDNKTIYKDARVYLVFRDKAQEYISEYVSHNNEKISAFLSSKLGRFEFGNKLLNNDNVEKSTKLFINPNCNWSEDFKWQGKKKFVFGKYGTIDFSSNTVISLFRELTKWKGGWVTVLKLQEITGKDHDYVRPMIGQIERRMSHDLRKYISLPSTEEDNLEPTPSQGAYRIKFTPNPL